MLMLSFRLGRTKRVVISVLAVGLLGLAGITGVRQVMKKNTVPTITTAAVEEQSKVVQAKKVTVKTNEQRLVFIRSFGWEVEEEPLEVMEVIIPKEFDSVYIQYNQIQQKQGYDLEKQAGKRCKRYSYKVTNYPGETGEVRLNLLVRDNKVIGGDVCSLNQNGFMQGFVQTA